jgi:hypothetical protein
MSWPPIKRNPGAQPNSATDRALTIVAIVFVGVALILLGQKAIRGQRQLGFVSTQVRLCLSDGDGDLCPVLSGRAHVAAGHFGRFDGQAIRARSPSTTHRGLFDRIGDCRGFLHAVLYIWPPMNQFRSSGKSLSEGFNNTLIFIAAVLALGTVGFVGLVSGLLTGPMYLAARRAERGKVRRLNR